MELTPGEFELFRDLTWFEPDPALPGVPALRPLSICSYKALKLLKQRVFFEEHGLDAEEERRQIALYVWMHSNPIAEVSGALWDNSWRAAIPPVLEALTDGDVLAFLEYRIRTLSAIEASRLFIRPKPPSRFSAPRPDDIIVPSEICSRLSTISRARGWDKDEILWRTWLPQALQLYYTECYWNGDWTVRSGSHVAPDERHAHDGTPDWAAGIVTPAPHLKVDIPPTES